MKKYKIEDIICIDETSIKSLQKRNRCYSNKGKYCVIKTQSPGKYVPKNKTRKLKKRIINDFYMVYDYIKIGV